MIRSRKISLVVLMVAALSVFGSVPARAQQSHPITAEVDRTSVALGETITLTITVRSDSISPPSPDMPVLDGFDTLSTSTSSSFSLINGRVESSSVYVVILQPQHIGTLTIPPYGIKLGNRTYQTDVIQIEVSEMTPDTGRTPPAGLPMQPESNGRQREGTFVEAEVDNLNPYVGESVVYVFRLNHRSPLVGRSYYSAPAFTGFWTEKETTQKEYETQIDGTFYRVSELRTILFPTTAGEVTIEPAQLTISGGFFEPDIRLQSEPVNVNVKPLPADAPVGFNGAVGKYSVHGDISPKQGTVGEPITYTLTISGEENLNNLPDPQWPTIDDWRVFDSKGSVEAQISGDTVVGKRVYERLLVPQREGNMTIPALEYVFFDPEKSAYEVVASEAIPVSVQAGEPEAPTSQTAVPNAKTEVKQLSSDIRFLKPLPSRLGSAGLPLVSDGFYWLAWVLSIIFLAVNLAWEWVYTHRQENAPFLRSSHARQRARKAISRSLRMTSENAHAQVGEILNEYLADKLGVQVSGLTRPALAAALQEHGLQALVIQRVEEMLDAAEAGRFSPQAHETGDGIALLHGLSSLLDDLERGFVS